MYRLPCIIGHIQDGRVRALAVTSADRHPLLPDVPAMRETMPELANYDVSTWFALFGPAGLPAEIVASLNAETNAFLDLPETHRRFNELGGAPFRVTPAELAAFIRAETARWGDVIRREGLQMDAG